MSARKGNKNPTIKVPRKSSSHKTRNYGRTLPFCEVGERDLRSPGNFGGMQKIGSVSGRERAWHHHSTGSPCSWPPGVTGFCTTGQDIS